MSSDLAGQRVAVVAKSANGHTGVTAAVLHYCRALRTLGAEVQVLILTGEAQGAQSFTREGFDIRALGLSKHSRKLATSRALHEVLAAASPDWVHAHCYEPAVHVSRALNWGLCSRLAVVLHDSRRRPARRLIAWPYRLLPELVIAPSASVAKTMGAWYGYPARRTTVLPHPVESCFFELRPASAAVRTALDLTGRVPVILWTARLQRHKGHADLLRAFRAIVTEYPAACLVLAGSGKLEGALRRLTCRLGLDDHVRFAGMRQDVPELLSVADVFACPSHSETLCMSVQEAMAAGRPVVATRVWGPDEYIRSGDTGLLVPPRRPQALSRAMLELCGDRVRAEAMGAAARRYAAEHFTAESFTRRLGSLMGAGPH